MVREVLVPTDIIMPQLGESIAEGTVVKWLIPPGGRVERDQPLLEVETDKVSLEIPSPATGLLSEVLVQAGETVPVGTLLGRLEGAAAAAEGVVSRVGGVVLRPIEPPGAGEDHYSPAVRQLAKEQGVELAHVQGTGAGGRVTRKDVLEFVGKRGATPTRPSPLEGEGKGGAAAEEILPFTQMRKTIAERMVKSRQTSAHVVTFFEADFSGVARFREVPRQGSAQGRTLTYLPFVINATARAIRAMPILNASWGEQGIVIKRDIHVGVAVALEDGLLVPVVRDADKKGLLQLATEVADLAERARTKKLKPEEVQGGTFTITNHGGFGSLFSTPIIHQPQIAILGVGAVQKRPVIVNDAIAVRPMGYLSLSFDHRVIDGATADQFMSKLKGFLEQSDWEKFL
jgi:2-oxoglutarate dehydrogenase E2 component (dihydrolipoamide succinyltransferase)/2-oxoisovalerate dehydrogenase E2 component (dihydrolipoyl transacylase)